MKFSASPATQFVAESSQADLARFLGVGMSTVSTWVARDEIPATALLALQQYYRIAQLESDLGDLRRALAVLAR